jgi:tetratricopeptide (TPR) repeat protein
MNTSLTPTVAGTLPAVDDLLQAAFDAYERGAAADAEASCRRILALDPDHAGALALTGFIQLGQARYGEAVPVFDRLCTLAPGEPSHWVNLGNAYRGIGEHDDALKAFERAAGLGERSLSFHFNLGLLHIARGDYEAARAVLAEAVRQAPDDVEVRYRYVTACYECMQNEAALAAVRDWEPPPDAPSEALAGLAQMMLNMGELQRAKAFIQAATRGRQADPAAELISVQIRERTNRLDEATAQLQRLRARPDAAGLGAELQRVAGRIAQRRGQHELAVELFRQALVDYGKPQDQHYLLFPLAESLHALGRTDEVITTLIEAHRSQAFFIRRSRPLAALRGPPQMEITDYRCDPEDVAGWDHSGAPGPEDSPVFVVAFPRSGTTLLELALDAHPQLLSMDEQPFVQNCLDDMLALGVKYPEQLAGLTPEQLNGVRTAYWQRVAKKVQLGPGQRLVDKNPLNILRLPVIGRVFPHARIVLALRHPCDVILSCYMQHFRAPDFALLCSDMPALTIGYRRTFDFWYETAALLKPQTLEVRYEDFVSNLPAQLQHICAFLAIPWDERMLTPAERAHAKGYISTPSYSQVVQPVNRRAVDRWRRYYKYLEPALKVVQPYLERWGYES